MKRPDSIQITIHNPCNQVWDDMIPVTGGRFCQLCQNTVVDFTSYSDSLLYQFVAETKGTVCGKFYASQTGRPIARPAEPGRVWYPGAIALGMTLLFAHPTDAGAKVRPPFAIQKIKGVPHKKHNTTPPDSNGISGTVYLKENQKTRKTKATVILYRDDSEINRVVTDEKSRYRFYPLEPGKYTIMAIGSWRETAETEVTVAAGTMTIQNMVVSTKEILLGMMYR